MSRPARPTQPVWYSVVAILVCIVMMTVTTTVLLQRQADQAAELSRQARQEAQQAARESERRWCGLVTSLDDAYRSSPPQTPVGQRMAMELATLRMQFGCPPPG